MATTRIRELAWQPRVRDVMSYLYYGYGSSAPSDGEGAGTAVKGSLFVDIVSGIVYRNAFGYRLYDVWNAGRLRNSYRCRVRLGPRINLCGLQL